MKLRTHLEATHTPVPEFAKRIGVSVAALHRYLTGQRLPRPDVMEKIVRETQGSVQPNDFFEFSSATEAA